MENGGFWRVCARSRRSGRSNRPPQPTHPRRRAPARYPWPKTCAIGRLFHRSVRRIGAVQGHLPTGALRKAGALEFFKHWARVEEHLDVGDKQWHITRYGGSNVSGADAADKARRSLERLRRRLRTGESPDSYEYGQRALREEIVETIGDPASPAAVVTRNGYGALVLNTAHVLFADIDAPPRLTIARLLSGLLHILIGTVPEEPAEPTVPASISSVAEKDPKLGIRVYRTAAGFRCLVVSRIYDPMGAEADQLLSDLRSDPLYKRLCRAQECFRARLTPKFWRCGAPRPPSRFPWTCPQQESAMRAWEAAYRDRCQAYAVCQLVDVLGSERMHPEAAAIVRLHDEMTCREGLPLA